MSANCGNCDCADKTQCTKKGSSMYMFETVNNSFTDNCVVLDDSVAENDGKCKCGTGCTCTGCACGH